VRFDPGLGGLSTRAREGECELGTLAIGKRYQERISASDVFGQSLRAREAEWELGTFATDKYRSSHVIA
jgi:hypothetical protein